MTKNFEQINLLLDFYGSMLTERQRSFLEYYYEDDLSLAEIAENEGITRQGVRDVIVRAEAIMTEMEDKTGLLKRFMQMRDKLTAIEEAAAAIRTINYRQYDNAELAALTDVISTNAAALKE